MNASSALIITTIAPPNSVLARYAKECGRRGVDFIIAGDRKSPPDFYLKGTDFWSIERQKGSGFKSARKIPENHYARKNIAYLAAIQKGHEVILETDDDNLPYEDFWNLPERKIAGNMVRDHGWINIYRLFSREMIWPRGLPLEHLCDARDYTAEQAVEHDCPIQQGLSDGDPDVDAVYRLTRKLPVSFKKDLVFVLGKGSWCPFNSQNTVWFREAFPLMYLPSECSFRMTDIWRSFVAMRIAWEYGWKIAFRYPTVYQERNEHDLLRDFRDEIPGYLNNSAIANALGSLELSGRTDDIRENLSTCYRLLSGMGLVGKGELDILGNWNSDLEGIL
jgi:hypothetical protein